MSTILLYIADLKVSVGNLGYLFQLLLFCTDTGENDRCSSYLSGPFCQFLCLHCDYAQCMFDGPLYVLDICHNDNYHIFILHLTK